MPDYRRMRVPGGCYFFTVNIMDRRQSLLIDHIDVLREVFHRVKSRYFFHIDAVVILPDHLHTIWTLPLGDERFDVRWNLIKRAFSRELPQREPISTSRSRRRERGIWQRRYWEHTLTDEDDYRQHVDYIHYNPVKHGHAARPIDWPYSSFHRYVKAGILPTDWGTASPPADHPWG